MPTENSEFFFKLLLYSLLIGAFLGIFYDALRISRLFLTLPYNGKFRIIEKANSITVFVVALIEDIIFFVVAAIAVALFVFNANKGNFRGFMLFGTVAGFLIYLVTIGKITGAVASLIVNTFRKITYLFIKFVFIPPIRWLIRLFVWLYGITLKPLVKKITDKYFSLHTESQFKKYCQKIDELKKT